MKRRFVCYFMILLILTSMIIGLNGCDSKKSKTVLTVKQVQEQFASSFDLFQKCTNILWNRLDYFFYLLDEMGNTSICSTSAVNHQLYFSDEEWLYISELFEKHNLKQIKYEQSSLPVNGCYAPALGFSFYVQHEEEHGGVYILYNIITYGSANTLDIAEAIDDQITYIKQYGKFSKLSYDNWYEWLSDPEED